MQCVVEKCIPLFHYCSECVDDGPCVHPCCKIWLIQACVERGVASHSTSTSTETHSYDALMLLATVATVQQQKESDALTKCRGKISWKKNSESACHKSGEMAFVGLQKVNQAGAASIPFQKKSRDTLSLKRNTRPGRTLRLKLAPSHPHHDVLRMERMDKRQRQYIAQNICRISKKCGAFISRTQIFRKEIERCLARWHALTRKEKGNLYTNTKYIIDVIDVHISSDCVKQAGSLPYMQFQGSSNHCGVCAFNNAVGREVITVRELNNVADDLWLGQFEKLELSITDDVQRHRDPHGFHSLDTIHSIATRHGYSLSPLHHRIKSMCKSMLVPELPQLVFRELTKCYQLPVKLFVVNYLESHYTAIDVDRHIIWYLDSLQRKPYSITQQKLLSIFVDKNNVILHLREDQAPQDSSLPQQSSADVVVCHELEESRFISVKCQACCIHYPLRDIKQHMHQCQKGAGRSRKYTGVSFEEAHKEAQKESEDMEVIYLDTDTSSDDEFPDITKPPPKQNYATHTGSISSEFHVDEDARVQTLKEDTSLLKGVPRDVAVLRVVGCFDTCTRNQLRGILQGDWLDSEVLSLFMSIENCRNKTARQQQRTRQTMRFMSPHFYTKWLDYLSTNKVCVIKRKTSYIKNHPCNWVDEKPSDLHKLILLVNIENHHWILCVMDFQKCIISTFDSLTHSPYHSIGNNLRPLVTEMYAYKENEVCNTSLWSTQVQQDFSCQTNNSDCGIFVCKISDCILIGRSVKIQPDSEMLRNWLVRDILASSHTEVLDAEAVSTFRDEIHDNSSCDESVYDTADDSEASECDELESYKPLFLK